MAVQQLDADTAESLAGVVRLLRRAAELFWLQAGREGPRSSRQLLAVGVDIAVDEGQELLTDHAALEGPVPVGDSPIGLLRSAKQLLAELCRASASTGLQALAARVVELVWEANTGAEA